MATEDVVVEFGAGTDGATTAIDALQKQFEGMLDTLKALGPVAEAIGVTLAAAFVVDKVMDFAEGIAKVGEELNNMMAMLGMSAEQMTILAGTAEVVGIDVGSLGATYARLARNMVEAQNGTGAASDAFRALDISVTGADGKLKSLDTITGEIADKFSTFADGANKTALAMELGGRGMAKMIPLLNMGSAETARLKEELVATGSVLSGAMVQGMAETADKFDMLHLSMKGVSITLFEAVKPGVDSLVESLTSFVQAMNRSLQEGGALNYVLMAVVIALNALITAIDAVITFIAELVGAFDAGITSIGLALKLLDKLIGDVLSPSKWGNITKDTAEGLNAIGKVWADYYKKLAEQEAAFEKRLKQTWSNIGFGGVGTGDRTPSGPDTRGAAPSSDDGRDLVDARAKTEEQIALIRIARERMANDAVFDLGRSTIDDLYNEEVKSLEDKFQVQRKYLMQHAELVQGDALQYEQTLGQLRVLEEAHQAELDKNYIVFKNRKAQLEQQEVQRQIQLSDFTLQDGLQKYQQDYNNYLITLDEKVEGEKRLTEAIAQEQIKRLQIQQQAYAQGSKQWLQLNDQMVRIRQQHNQQIDRIDNQLTQRSTQRWATFGRSMMSTFGQVTSGLLKYTMSWNEAFITILDSLLDAFINMGVEMVSNWLITELTKSMISTATATSGALAQITDAAAVAAANAYASTAAIPYVGPALAPAAAATALAATLSFGSMVGAGGAIGAFEQGGLVPDDGLNLLHKREMVLPEHISTGLQDMIAKGGTGGGGPVHIHGPLVSAIDTQTGAAFLARNIGKIARDLKGHLRANPSLRPENK